MDKKEVAANLLEKGGLFKIALGLIMDYVGTNSRLFEKDDLERRARVLELEVGDSITNFTTALKGKPPNTDELVEHIFRELRRLSRS